jgi:hypothetical protein
MSPLDSQQLITLITAQKKSPTLSLLSLFDLLDAHVKQNSNPQAFQQQAIFNQTLTDFFKCQAKNAGANAPSVLAEHILLIAQNACKQQLTHPETPHLMHAKKAAEALITAQTGARPLLDLIDIKSLGIAACIGLLAVGVLLFWPTLLQKGSLPPAMEATTNTQAAHETKRLSTQLTAQQASEMYAKYETMRNGTCQFLEAIQIPDKDKAVYLESVVGGKLPTNLGDLAIANAYLEKVRCNYTPMLMKNSR